MYGNPMLNNQFSLNRIDNNIKELQALREQYQNSQIMPQQPIQNIINTTSTNNIDFEARYLKENENVEDLLVQRKTCFIDLKKGFIAIKELDGNITKYELVLPKDEKDLEIERLNKIIKEMERNEPYTNDKSNTKIKKPTSNNE